MRWLWPLFLVSLAAGCGRCVDDPGEPPAPAAPPKPAPSAPFMRPRLNFNPPGFSPPSSPSPSASAAPAPSGGTP